jgi:hypothetical protein
LPIVIGNNIIYITFPDVFVINSSASSVIVSSPNTVISYSFVNSKTIQVILQKNLTIVYSLTIVNTVQNPAINGSYLVELTIGNYSYN